MQAITTQKANAAFITNLSNILNKPARSLGTLILDTQARQDLDVICDGATLGLSSQFSCEESFAPASPLDLLVAENAECEADRSEWALLNGAITLSLASQINTPKAFDTEIFAMACQALETDEDRLLLGEIEMSDLPKQERKGHGIRVKGIKMIRRVGKFFC